MARSKSKVGAKAAKLRTRARVKFAKALTKVDIKAAKLRGRERAKKAGRRR